MCKMGEVRVGLALIAVAGDAETRFDTPVAHFAARCCQREQEHMPPAAQELYLILRQMN